MRVLFALIKFGEINIQNLSVEIISKIYSVDRFWNSINTNRHPKYISGNIYHPRHIQVIDFGILSTRIDIQNLSVLINIQDISVLININIQDIFS